MVHFRDGWPLTWTPFLYSASLEGGLHLRIWPPLESPEKHSWTNSFPGVLQRRARCSCWRHQLGGLCWWHNFVQLSHLSGDTGSRCAGTAGVCWPTAWVGPFMKSDFWTDQIPGHESHPETRRLRPPPPLLRLLFGGSLVPDTTNITLLGVEVDAMFSFSDHLRSVATRARQKLWFLTRVAHILTTGGRTTVYKAFVTNHGVRTSYVNGSGAESPSASEQHSASHTSGYRPWCTPTQLGYPPYCCLPVQAALVAWSSAGALCVARAQYPLYQPQNSQQAW